METNLPQRPDSTQTQENYVEEFYQKQSPTSGNHYDAVYAFFLSRTNNNKQAAASLTSSLLNIAHQTNVNPMLVLEDFKKYNQNQSFKAALIGFFNQTRRSTSKIGFSANSTPSPVVFRNIRS